MRSEAEVCSAIDRYSDMVVRLCMVYLKNSADTEDIVQTVFLKYALSTTVFASADHEKAWLLRVTANACKDVLKSFFRRCTVPLEDWQNADAELPEDVIALRQALKSLPQKYREVLYLHYYEGYSVPEIGNILSRNPNTVYTHLSRAKDMLRQLLGGVEDA